MKRFVLLAAFLVLPLAAEEEARRLESVTWDPVRHELQWVVSKGKMDGEEYKPDAREKYEISIDGATMSFSDETRRFSKVEAESVRRVLDLLARYTAESTLWWEKGLGEVISKGLRVSNNKPIPTQPVTPVSPARSTPATPAPK